MVISNILPLERVSYNDKYGLLLFFFAHVLVLLYIQNSKNIDIMGVVALTSLLMALFSCYCSILVLLNIIGIGFNLSLLISLVIFILMIVFDFWPILNAYTKKQIESKID
jgi:presenilin-like A22 family membrane protease